MVSIGALVIGLVALFTFLSLAPWPSKDEVKALEVRYDSLQQGQMKLFEQISTLRAEAAAEREQVSYLRGMQEGIEQEKHDVTGSPQPLASMPSPTPVIH